MIAEHLPVVGHEYHDGVLDLPGPLKRVEHPPDLFVDEVAHGVVGGAGEAVVALGHLAEAQPSAPLAHPLIVFPLPDRLILQLPLDVVWERDLVDQLQVPLQVFAGRIERVVRVEDVHREQPRLL